MKKDNLSGNAKIAFTKSKVIFCTAVLGLVAAFQVSIMSRPAHAIKQYSQANGNIACSSCHSRAGLSNGTMYPLTGTGTYFKTNGVLPTRAAPRPVAPPVYPPRQPVAPPVYPPRQPVYPPYNPPQWRNPQPPIYPQPPVYPRPTVSLAYPLQKELQRLGCRPGRADGVWGRNSRAALRRFANQARLRLGSEPSQNALDVARRTPSGYCPPVRPVYNPPRYNPPRYNPPIYNPPPRRQPVTQACPDVRRLARVIRNQGFGNVQWKDCDLQQRYTFFALQGGNRWRLRIRSNGVIYKRQLR